MVLKQSILRPSFLYILMSHLISVSLSAAPFTVAQYVSLPILSFHLHLSLTPRLSPSHFHITISITLTAIKSYVRYLCTYTDTVGPLCKGQP